MLLLEFFETAHSPKTFRRVTLRERSRQFYFRAANNLCVASQLRECVHSDVQRVRTSHRASSTSDWAGAESPRDS